jgi:hypothetical protein
LANSNPLRIGTLTSVEPQVVETRQPKRALKSSVSGSSGTKSARSRGVSASSSRGGWA